MTEVVTIVIISLVVVRVVFLIGHMWSLANAQSFPRIEPIPAA
jgi:hypothetical protein